MRVITTPEEFIGLVDNAHPAPRQDSGGWWTHAFNPPCHASSSRRSGHVGYDAGGALRVGCWHGCGWLAIERALGGGILLGIRYPDGSVRGRHNRDGSDGSDGDYERAGRRPVYMAAPPEPVRLPALLAEGRVVTLGDILACRRWFPCDGRKKGWFVERGGKRFNWRQIVGKGKRYGADAATETDSDRVRAAVEGCVAVDAGGRKINVPPHDTYAGVLALLERGQAPDDITPALSLAGGADYPFPYPLVVLDCDYQPADDDDARTGQAARDRLAGWLDKLGCPIFPSSSGNGWHALFLFADEDVEVAPRAGREGQTAVKVSGLKFDLFPPGAHSLVRLRVGAVDYPADCPLPTLRRDDFYGVVKAAVTDGRAVDAPNKAHTAAVAAPSAAGGVVAPAVPDEADGVVWTAQDEAMEEAGRRWLAQQAAAPLPGHLAPCGWPACRHHITGGCARNTGCPDYPLP